MKCKKCGHNHVNYTDPCVRFDPTLVEGLAERNLQRVARQRKRSKR